MNRIEASFKDFSGNPSGFAGAYLSYLSEIFQKIDNVALGNFIVLMLDAQQSRKRIFFIGNGGSAATASHFANDFGIGTRSLDKPFRAFSLTDNVAAITAIGNDFGYEEIFYRQLANCDLQHDDIVVAISASGNSPNIVKAAEYSISKGAYLVGLTGFDGGELKRLSHLNLHVPCERGEYGPVEDLHMIFDHVAHAYISLAVRSYENSKVASPTDSANHKASFKMDEVAP